jgi:hypothetical protein
MTPLVLKSASETLAFDRRSGRLVSFRSACAPGVEFIASAPDHPVFVIQGLDSRRAWFRITSRDAAAVSISATDKNGRRVVTMQFRGLAGLDLSVTTTVAACAGEPGSRWGLSVRNGAGLRITDVQYPFVVVGYGLHGTVLLPHYAGREMVDPAPEALGPDDDAAFQFSPENGDSAHYPGGLFAQFLAFYNNRAGLYMACEDGAANVKLIKAVHRAPGIRLGLAHAGDWPAAGERTLEYDIVLRGFKGGWMDAADLYRAWSSTQPWSTPLSRRTDVPAWLLDSPAYITVRLQGELDIGPVFPVKEFLPYEKILPLLDRLARRIGAPLVAVLMAWERGGPWVYPDCFPPVGGEASMKRFIREIRRRGWRAGSFCNGTRWVTRHAWNGYDGRELFRAERGQAGVCRTPRGELWEEAWDKTWRPSYACCLGAGQTRRLATEFVKRLAGWGMESIQFFDQNMGAATFPCFSDRHGHPPGPGKWMAREMRAVMAAFRRAEPAGAGEVMHSTEGPCNETCLPFFQQCDVRVIPPGHTSNYAFLPLYHYLYHDCITLQGGMGMGPEPHHLETRNACNGVLGEIPGAVMTGDGTLLNRDTGNWANWKPKVGSDAAAAAMLRSVLALRRGAGRDFLVYGGMLRPAEPEGIPVRTWERESRMNRIPALFHAAWQAPDGRTGVVLANWTDKPVRTALRDERLGLRPALHLAGKSLESRLLSRRGTSALFDVTVPAHGCALVSG